MDAGLEEIEEEVVVDRERQVAAEGVSDGIDPVLLIGIQVWRSLGDLIVGDDLGNLRDDGKSRIQFVGGVSSRGSR